MCYIGNPWMAPGEFVSVLNFMKKKKKYAHFAEMGLFYFCFCFLSNLMTPRRFLNTHLGASLGITDDSDGKEPTCSARDLGLTPGSGRGPGEGNGYPLYCSCLENSMDRRARQACVHGVTQSWTQQSNYHTRAYIPTSSSVLITQHLHWNNLSSSP